MIDSVASALAANLVQGVLFEDDSGRLLLTNRAFVDLFDLRTPPEELAGVDLREMLGATAGCLVEPDESARAS